MLMMHREEDDGVWCNWSIGVGLADLLFLLAERHRQ